MPRSELVIIAAVAENNAIGLRGQLPWSLPEDLKHFKQATLGHACIMGRRSFEERNKPLPERRNIVVTSLAESPHPGIEIAPSLKAAIDLAETTPGPTFLLGGRRIFEQGLQIANRFERTRVHGSPEADTFFPDCDESNWSVVSERHHPADDRHAYSLTFQTLVRRGV